ncbi:alpha/beta hydrolase [Phenylobacterium montanum]|uniref:Alpha/beta fold hydrolase n=1 Tax=Phenylobacterium montanum TaxID=2823693 RepID=A0A975G1Z2_9CAUL|nr:alpha/beta fold hydrolase [Caulobacter sp. S6]QUD89299.1 alpha/beta fold hydrolase [Caulobacter sp. S6]
MEPVLVGRCAGWWSRGRSGRAVLLCPALGREGEFAHRSWRRIAQSLSDAGHTVLCFSYRGEGDSGDLADNEDSVRAWVDDVKAAIAWLKSQAPREDLVIVGLRFGCLAAAAAAAEIGDIDGLAMIDPVVSGRAYRRHLVMIAKLTQRDPIVGGAISVSGIDLNAPALASLEKLEPFKDAVPLPERILLITPQGAQPDKVLAQRLDDPALAVERADFPDYANFLVDADFSVMPPSIVELIGRWVGEAAPEAPEEAPSGSEPWLGACSLPTPGATETLQFLPGPSPLFGVVCQADAAVPGDPAVVLVNTGSTSHVGTGRLWVALARQLALRGLTSLRFDVAGVGDSPDRPGQRPPIEHLSDGFADVTAALDHLQKLGHDRFVLVGFCRGAQLAFNIAQRDPRVVGQFLIGTPELFWTDRPAHRVATQTWRYLRLVRDPQNWRMTFTGRMTPLRLVKAIVRIAMRTSFTPVARVRAWFVARSVRAVTQGRVQTWMFFGDEDEFIKDLEEYFATPRTEFERLLGVKSVFMAQTAHLFVRKTDRERLIEALIERLQPANSLADRLSCNLSAHIEPARIKAELPSRSAPAAGRAG